MMDPTKEHAMPDETCRSAVYPPGAFQSYTCGRPAKGHLQNGQPACGLHLAGERRAIATAERKAAEYRQRERDVAAIRAELRTLAPDVAATCTITSPDRVSVDAAALLALARRAR